ncbi:MAG: 4Fe-4S dicluster domain-containing protein [Lentimicrobiaceae bacterium]|nr:4Fe-4S dicluster domain-containing protein [Lentimicrobiaceae bacterium]
MLDFGYHISKTGTIDLDKTNNRPIRKMEELIPSFKACIFCGACTSTCSAGSFTPFNIRKTHSLFRRGQYKELSADLEKCMLCGKCTLVCPCGVNLRGMIMNMRELLTV